MQATCYLLVACVPSLWTHLTSKIGQSLAHILPCCSPRPQWLLATDTQGCHAKVTAILACSALAYKTPSSAAECRHCQCTQAGTSGCTVEAAQFREHQKEFEGLGAQIVGISGDSPKDLDVFQYAPVVAPVVCVDALKHVSLWHAICVDLAAESWPNGSSLRKNLASFRVHTRQMTPASADANLLCACLLLVMCHELLRSGKHIVTGCVGFSVACSRDVGVRAISDALVCSCCSSVSPNTSLQLSNDHDSASKCTRTGCWCGHCAETWMSHAGKHSG